MTDFPFAIVGFDLDGTLLDTHVDLGTALNHALALAGRPAVPVARVRDLIGGGAKLMLKRALADTGGAVPEERLSELHRELIAYYRDNIAVHSIQFPGGPDMLDALEARGVQLAVVTNKLESLARLLLDQLGLTWRFGVILGGDSLGPGRAKPAPDLLLAMQERLGGGRAAFIGDSSFDIRAARAASWPCVGVSFGFNDVPVNQLGADAVIDHYDELIPALERL
jgi:phosphoglycolate phosphatase